MKYRTAQMKTVAIEEDVLRELKIIAAQNSTTIIKLADDFLRAGIQREKMKPAAKKAK